jgi:hypothetical protein
MILENKFLAFIYAYEIIKIIIIITSIYKHEYLILRRVPYNL